MSSQIHVAFANGQPRAQPRPAGAPRDEARGAWDAQPAAPRRRAPSPFATPIWSLLAAEIAAR